MTPEFAFTVPSAHVTVAREAIARLESHLGRVIGPLDPASELASVIFAALELESVNPPYPPIDLEDKISVEPAADLMIAIRALMAASAQASTVQETRRFAYAARDLRELIDSPYLTASGSTDNGERA